jgi:short subunit dehydrogenase-like uncharacterized protein
MHRWMIYGANGYSAGLVIELAKKAGHDVILAGRNAQSIMELGKKHGLQTCTFGLDDKNVIIKCLQKIEVVLNCAGPFSRTAKAMVEACMVTKTVYLDITGEIDVFEMIHAKNMELVKAGTTAIPGVGFDVVPSDCLAKMLSELMPDAHSLELAFYPKDSRFSPGTMKTMVEGLSSGGRIRSDNQITHVPAAFEVKSIEFKPGRPKTCATIPWGDISTAWHSTKIPNIKVFTTASPGTIKSMRLSRYTGWLLAFPPVQALAKEIIGRKIKGPDAETRVKARTLFWGEAKSSDGKVATMRMETPEGYTLTAESALKCVEHCLSRRPAPGALTPSVAFGARFVKELTGVTIDL